MKNNDIRTELRSALEKLGAREFEMVALEMDPGRGLAALKYAQEKGAEHPISYAIKMFDEENWQPSGERARIATNVAVEVRCSTCSGDRFIMHRTRLPQQTPWMKEHGISPPQEPIEEMKPCPDCNSGADTGFWRVDGSRFTTAK